MSETSFRNVIHSSLKIIFSFLKIKRITHFHCHQVLSVPLQSSASEVHLCFTRSPVRILIPQCLSRQRNKEHLIELINGSIPSFRLVKMKQENLLLEVEALLAANV